VPLLFTRPSRDLWLSPCTRPRVDTDWHFEQVRHEIKRLTEILRNESLTTEDRAIAQSQLDHYLATIHRSD
jgi:hypothetical protein